MGALAVFTFVLLCSSAAVGQRPEYASPAVEPAGDAYGGATVSAAQPSTAVEPMASVVPEGTVLSSLVVPSDASVTPGSVPGATPAASTGSTLVEPAAAAELAATTSSTDLAAADAAGQGQVVEPAGGQVPVVVPLLSPASEPSTEPSEETAAASTPDSLQPVMKHRRAGGALITVAAVTPAAITSITCKLDAVGNVADVFYTTSAGTTTYGCTGNAAVLTGGRNVLVDVSDSLVLQVQQGKLTSVAGGPVSWLAFKTQSSDMRTCGMNVQPSSATAVMTRWTAAANVALSSLTFTCAGSVLQSFASVTFATTMPVFQSLGYGIPADCTPVFSAPQINVTGTSFNTNCKTWVASSAGKKAATPNATNPCPYASTPAQWVQLITKQQLPDIRPPNWVYMNVDTAVSQSVKYNTVPPASCLFLCNAQYITASVTHALIPNVTSAMINWWFNGNVDGDMVHPTNGQVYPRYLVWHPRDHVSQDTLLPGPTPGSANGAYWSIVEFMLANSTSGYTKASAAGSWAKNYIAYNSIKVYSLTANSLDMRVEVDGSNPFRLLHTWSDTTVDGKPALNLTSSMTLGLTSGIAVGTMNPVSWELFGGDCAYKAANVWVQHCVEEMGNLQYFLPQLYHTSTGL